MTLTPRELSLLSNTDVLGYVQASNAKRNAQAVAEGWQMWTTIPESPEYLADFANCYELELRGARGTYYDMHREIHCYRPSFASYEHLTLVELEDLMEEMAQKANRMAELEAKWAAEEEERYREEVALGLTEPDADVVLEPWEVFERLAEDAGYGA